MANKVKRFKNPAGVRKEAEWWIAELKDSDRTKPEKAVDLIIKFFNIWLRSWELESDTSENESGLQGMREQLKALRRNHVEPPAS